MDLDYTEAEEDFRRRLRAWLADVLPKLPEPPDPADWPGRRAYDCGWQRMLYDAGYAGLFTVFAKVPVEIDGQRKQRVTAFIVDAHSAGISLGQPEQKMGIKASDTRTVNRRNLRTITTFTWYVEGRAVVSKRARVR